MRLGSCNIITSDEQKRGKEEQNESDSDLYQQTL
jgi:hypothetical protein